MAEHDNAAEETESVAAADEPEDLESEETEAEGESDSDRAGALVRAKHGVHARFTRLSGPVAVGLAVIVSLGGLGGWLGYRLYQDHQVQARRHLYVQVARQTAEHLTTISYTEVDADIKRVLDSATGGFHDEYQTRSQPFVEVVKKVQSKSEGTVSEVGLVSATKDQGQVLVAVAVKTTMGAAPAAQEPRRWRMRLTVDKTGDGAKVSKVEFVP